MDKEEEEACLGIEDEMPSCNAPSIPEMRSLRMEFLGSKHCRITVSNQIFTHADSKLDDDPFSNAIIIKKEEIN